MSLSVISPEESQHVQRLTAQLGRYERMETFGSIDWDVCRMTAGRDSNVISDRIVNVRGGSLKVEEGDSPGVCC